ncbi:hypothetical protein GUJ93_ZPchr0013g33786 [Zizania palustris]|uniref:Secreted protein n=1 Tax=Zizania palustris TaxID=103762 RepID=A0A8J6BY14_ZIZPA|nr:hypothetical protein GUJ93_ZPchr0013g33786 [Zizania palustris]
MGSSTRLVVVPFAVSSLFSASPGLATAGGAQYGTRVSVCSQKPKSQKGRHWRERNRSTPTWGRANTDMGKGRGLTFVVVEVPPTTCRVSSGRGLLKKEAGGEKGGNE